MKLYTMRITEVHEGYLSLYAGSEEDALRMAEELRVDGSEEIGWSCTDVDIEVTGEDEYKGANAEGFDRLMEMVENDEYPADDAQYVVKSFLEELSKK